MDFSQSNRGYGFVRYTNAEDAIKAVEKLDNYEIRPNHQLGVMLSVDNRKLFISSVPEDATEADVQKELENQTGDVDTVKLHLYKKDKTSNKTRRFALVEYKSHRAASLARRHLVPNESFMGQENVKVEWAWADLTNEFNYKVHLRVIYLCNLQPETSESEIFDIFAELCDHQVDSVHKVRDFAFVHFHSHAAAKTALNRTNGKLLIDDEEVQVRWSNHINRKKKVLQSRRSSRVSQSSSNRSSSSAPRAYPRFDFSAPIPFVNPGQLSYPPPMKIACDYSVQQQNQIQPYAYHRSGVAAQSPPVAHHFTNSWDEAYQFNSYEDESYLTRSPHSFVYHPQGFLIGPTGIWYRPVFDPRFAPASFQQPFGSSCFSP
jgi:RNA recognition motif-containing protein